MTDKRNLDAIFGDHSLEAINHRIDLLLEDDSASQWLRSALALARHRDPVDALNDAETLAEILDARFQALMMQNGGFDPQARD